MREELLSPNNGVKGKTGIQVEVYFSDYRKKNESDIVIANNVIKELIEITRSEIIEVEDFIDKEILNKWKNEMNQIPFESKGGTWKLRYYQDIAITKTLDAIAKGKSLGETLRTAAADFFFVDFAILFLT